MPRASLIQAAVMSQDVTSSRVYLMPYNGDDAGGVTIPDAGLSRSLVGLTGAHDLASFNAVVGPMFGSLPWGIGPSGYVPITGFSPITIGTGPNIWTNVNAAIDGVNTKPQASCALVQQLSPSVTSNPGMNNAYGLDMGAGNSVALAKVDLYPPSGDYLRGDGTSLSARVDWSDDLSTWAQCWSGTINDSNAGALRTIIAPNSGSHRAWRVMLSGNGINVMKLSQFIPYQYVSGGTSDPNRGWTMQGGWWRNSQPIVLATDTGNVAIAPGQARREGQVWLDDAGGTASRKTIYGFDRYCGLMNDYNRRPLALVGGDPSPPVNGHLAYSPAQGWDGTGYHFYPVRGNILIRLRLFSGAQDQSITVRYKPARFVNSSGAAAAYWASIGLNVTANVETTPNGTWANGNIDNLDSAIGSTDYAEYEAQPFIGQTNANAIEGARANVQAFWAENNMRLTATVWC